MTQGPGPDETQPFGWQAGQGPPPPPPPASYPPTPYPPASYPPASGPWATHPPAGWPPGARPAPYGVHPVTGVPWSGRSKATAGLLQLLLPFLGLCGVGRLYTGHVAIGLVQLIGFFVAAVFSIVLIGLPFLVGIWIWTVVDAVVVLAGDSQDAEGLPLR